MLKFFYGMTWLCRQKGVEISKRGKNVVISNSSNNEINVIGAKLIRFSKEYLNIRFNGKVLKGSGAQLRIYNRKKCYLAQADMNAFTIMPKQTPDMKFIIVAIRVKPKTEIEIEQLNLEFSEKIDESIYDVLGEETLIVTPSYPTDSNRYFGGFVHSRVSAYKQAGCKFDLVCIHEYNTISRYTFEGIEVLKGGFVLLDNILHKRKYARLMVHFFDEKYAKVFDRFDLSKSDLYFWVHGPETLYRDWNHFVTGYFWPIPSITTQQEEEFRKKDVVIQKYNNMPNVHWVFVSNWIKKHSEELTGIEFSNAYIIPNIIDENIFPYKQKTAEHRKHVFMVRRFDNVNKYAIDTDVRAIVELSRRNCFKDMEFHIYGEGDLYDGLVHPITDFPNVHLHKTFLTHDEIAKVHEKCGIGLFATRYDAQGVSMCEAARSGLVIAGSNIEAIREFIPEEYGTLCDPEDYIELANIMERLYKDEKFFLEASKATSEKIQTVASFENTIQKEIELFSIPVKAQGYAVQIPQESDETLLSVIIPSYNVEQFIEGTLASLVYHENSRRMEVLVVNDGSKDHTVEKVLEFKNRIGDTEDRLIRLINKENGGHGSTINKGIELARGKYLKVVDGDDIVDTDQFKKLIDSLEDETADAIVCNYYYDNINTPLLDEQYYYLFMNPGYSYKMDDVCLPYYGFPSYGPILATGTYKTQTMQNAHFKLSEKMFYVDMEFNAYVIMSCETVKYLPLKIYKYRQGSATQSISEASFRRNYKHHEAVLFNLIDLYEHADISEVRRKYIYTHLILPMVSSNYLIVTQYFNGMKKFLEFDQKLKEHSDIYYNSGDGTIQKARKTKGLWLIAKSLKRMIRNAI